MLNAISAFVDNVTFDDLAEAYGSDYPIDVDPAGVELPEAVQDALDIIMI